jgi:hypothetical protein
MHPAPAPPSREQRRRRTEETRGGFKLALQKIMRRIPRVAAPPPEQERHWLADTMDWLQQWADYEVMTEFDAAAADEPTRPGSFYDHCEDFSLSA